MSIADKLLTIANNTPEVCKKLAVTKTASGSIISVNDVSPTEHNLKIQLTSDTITDFSGIEVYRNGKNLIPYPYTDTTKTYNGIRYTDNGDGTITANGTATADSYFRLLDSNPFKIDRMIGRVQITGCPSGGSAETYYIDCVPTGHKCVGESVQLDINTKWFRFYIRVRKGTKVENLVFKPQVERGLNVTEFEKGTLQTATANTDGTVVGLTSVSPNMTLFTNAADVNINCEYSVGGDPTANEKFVELQNAFASAKETIQKYL